MRPRTIREKKRTGQRYAAVLKYDLLFAIAVRLPTDPCRAVRISPGYFAIRGKADGHLDRVEHQLPRAAHESRFVNRRDRSEAAGFRVLVPQKYAKTLNQEMPAIVERVRTSEPIQRLCGNVAKVDQMK